MTEGAPHEYKEKSGACADCGNSPVNHFEHYVSSTLAVWTADALTSGTGARASFAKWTDVLFDSIEQVLLRGLSASPFARFSTRIEGATTYRSQVIWEEASRRGISMEQVVLFGHGTEVYRAKLRGRWFFFQSLPIPQHKKGEGVGWMDDKYILKRALSSAGVPTPRIVSARSFPQVQSAMSAMGSAVVIKPRSGSRGRHTTVNVRTDAQAREAFRVARQLCPHVAVEEYLEGSVCRGSLVDGRLVGFFRADPPRVVGDGVSTIGELIAKANAQKPERVADISMTEEHLRFLSRMGLTLDSVIPEGKSLPLTHRTGRLFGGTTREMLGSEHPKLRAYLERAAATLSVSVVGFDLIIEDPEIDPDSQRWGIIEANSLPYIDLHYLALEGRPSNVAASVWDLWDDPIHSVGVDTDTVGATMGA